MEKLINSNLCSNPVVNLERKPLSKLPQQIIKGVKNK